MEVCKEMTDKVLNVFNVERSATLLVTRQALRSTMPCNLKVSTIKSLNLGKNRKNHNFQFLIVVAVLNH